MRRNLTDRYIAGLKAAPQGKRILISDGITPGLLLRVTDRNHKSFLLGARFPGSQDCGISNEVLDFVGSGVDFHSGTLCRDLSPYVYSCLVPTTPWR